jgi:hypothetical protein
VGWAVLELEEEDEDEEEEVKAIRFILYDPPHMAVLSPAQGDEHPLAPNLEVPLRLFPQ